MYEIKIIYNYVTDLKVATRKIKRSIWHLPCRAHNAIVHSLSYDIDHQLYTRMTKSVYILTTVIAFAGHYYHRNSTVFGLRLL